MWRALRQEVPGNHLGRVLDPLWFLIFPKIPIVHWDQSRRCLEVTVHIPLVYRILNGFMDTLSSFSVF